MKQHISKEQLKELNEVGRKAYSKWRVERNNLAYSKEESWHSLPTIGQMVEFLCEHLSDEDEAWGGSRLIREMKWFDNYSEEFCDALWEAVVEILNGQKNEGKAD